MSVSSHARPGTSGGHYLYPLRPASDARVPSSTEEQRASTSKDGSSNLPRCSTLPPPARWLDFCVLRDPIFSVVDQLASHAPAQIEEDARKRSSSNQNHPERRGSPLAAQQRLQQDDGAQVSGDCASPGADLRDPKKRRATDLAGTALLEGETLCMVQHKPLDNKPLWRSAWQLSSQLGQPFESVRTAPRDQTVHDGGQGSHDDPSERCSSRPI